MYVARSGFLLFLLLAAFRGHAAWAQTVTFDTSSSPFVSGHSNQGNYSDNASNPRPPTNDNYLVGAFNGDQYRDFFSFDLSTLNLTGKQVTSASLTLTQFTFESSTGRTSQQLSLYDVSTSASALKTTNGQNAATFTDLGSGNSYGTFTITAPSSSTDTVQVSLNSIALSDITQARGGFFSIGGALPTAASDAAVLNDEALFFQSGSPNVARLTLTLAPAPEPSSLLSLSLGALGLGVLRCRACRRAASILLLPTVGGSDTC